MKPAGISSKLALAASNFEKEKEYWLNKLSGEPGKSVFPVDNKVTTPLIQAGLEEERARIVEKDFIELMKLSRHSDYILHVILAAGITVLLNKYTGNNDIIIGMPIYKQESQGKYLNTMLAVRNQLHDTMSFKELLIQVRHTIIEAVENQNYPLALLVTHLGLPYHVESFPLFDVVLLLENIHQSEYLQDIKPNIIFSCARNCESLAIILEYNPLLYHRDTIKRILDHFTHLLMKLVVHIDMPLGKADIITARERKQVLYDFNNTGRKYPRAKTIHQVFLEQVEKSPHKIALAGISHSLASYPSYPAYPAKAGAGKIELVNLTYRELNKKADQLARQLNKRGLTRGAAGAVIGMMIDRSLEMIMGMLGILKAGAAYLAIDSKDPQQRKTYLLADSGTNILLTAPDARYKINDEVEAKGRLLQGLHMQVINLETVPGSKVKFSHPFMGSRGVAVAVSPAYIVYTSGSTGKPKGVIIQHRSVLRLVKNSNYMDFLRLNGHPDRWLLTGKAVFDITTFETWGPLLNGCTLFLAQQDVILDAENLEQYMINQKINLLHLIPQLFNQLAEQRPGIFSTPDTFLIGGDVVRPRQVNKIRNLYRHLKILHMYGPTENTTFSTCFIVDRDYRHSIPIGKPISNSHVYILDKNNRLQPVGIMGEICVSGDGVARGYLNQVELTMNKFVDNPFVPGKKMYYTGDMGRWLADGNIEFSGRIDHQVKIRGARIEPGEIERQILGYEGIKEAVVVEKKDNAGNSYLCAYYTTAATADEISHPDLKDHLTGNLPDFMIPAFLVYLEEIPLTSNGKIDKRALPQPAFDPSGIYAPPRDALEKKLTAVWHEITGIDESCISIDDHFFNKGGDSLKATLMISMIHKETHVKVPLTEVFRTPSIRGLAVYIRNASKDKFVSIVPVEKKDYYPLSSAQKRMYTIQRINVNSTGYNMLLSGVLEGNLDRERLENTFKTLVNRHESLRTFFQVVEEEPVQRIKDTIMLEIETFRVEPGKSGEPDKSGDFSTSITPGTAQEIETLLCKFRRPFDLTCAPLLRIGIIKIQQKKHLLMVDMHHIVSDGASMAVLLNEFMAVYNRAELPGIRLQYKDFSHYQAQRLPREELKKQEKYWLNRFSRDIPQLDLPIDFNRPEEQGFEGGLVCFEIQQEITEQIKKFTAKTGTTLFIVLLAVYNILLSKYTTQEDIVVGSGISGRTHADLANIVGMFVNMLVMWNRPLEAITFLEFLLEVKKSALEAFENQDYQFEELVQKLNIPRQANRNPLFDVEFTLQNLDIEEIQIPGLRLRTYESSTIIVKFDLVLHAAEQGNVINMMLAYAKDLFKPSTIDIFARDYLEILKQVLANPPIKIDEITISSTLSPALSSHRTQDIQFDL